MNAKYNALGRVPFALKTSTLALLCGFVGLAQAENPQSPITFGGLTLYGTVDVGASYQSHGLPQSDYYSAGGYTFPNKASIGATSQLSDNGLSQSTLGVRGEWHLSDNWAALFKAESAINPITLKLTNNQESLVQNNGLAITSQKTGTDSSLSGPFSMGLFAGLRSKTYGLITYGRQNTPLKDDFFKYDPLSNAAGFSAFGAYGAPAGGGNTENARLNNALRYQVDFDRLHADALFAGPTASQGGAAWQLGLGGKSNAFSVDAVIAQKNQGITALSLGYPSATSATSVTQLAVVPVKAGYNYAPAGSVPVGSALVGTVSDTRAAALFAKYDFNGPVVYAGLERITYSNPSSPLNAGFNSIGGYTFAIINNGAYTTDKIFDVKWLGAKYPATPKLDLMVAVYQFNQNSYTGNACTAPAAKSAGTSISVNTNNPCASGAQRSFSLAGVYKYKSNLDFYAGLMASTLSGGMASGFVNTSVYNLMTGLRYNF